MKIRKKTTSDFEQYIWYTNSYNQVREGEKKRLFTYMSVKDVFLWIKVGQLDLIENLLQT